MESDKFLVVERSYCDDDSKLSVGLANIHADVPDVEANKDKILRAASIFKERGVNIAVFPEFCLSGYFWDEREDCLAYMKQAVTEVHTDWIENELQPLIGGDLETIVLNNLVAGTRRAGVDRSGIDGARGTAGDCSVHGSVSTPRVGAEAENEHGWKRPAASSTSIRIVLPGGGASQ